MFGLQLLVVGLKGIFLHRPLGQLSDPGAGCFRVVGSPAAGYHPFPLAGKVCPVRFHEAGGLLGLVAPGEDGEGSHHQIFVTFAAETFRNFPQCFQKI